jgi:hypothetical protein
MNQVLEIQLFSLFKAKNSFSHSWHPSARTPPVLGHRWLSVGNWSRLGIARPEPLTYFAGLSAIGMLFLSYRSRK